MLTRYSRIIKSPYSLPQLNSVVKTFRAQQPLRKVRIIAAQHLLRTNKDLMQAMIDLGARPEEIDVIGKCYSSSRKVAQLLAKMGIHVAADSFKYNSHRDHHSLYSKVINQYLIEHQERLFADQQPTVIIDDGGLLISAINKLSHAPQVPPIDTQKMFAVEQTTAGYNHLLEQQSLAIPFFNVARSETKNKEESPHIARHALNKVMQRLTLSQLKQSKILILGNGFIGQALKEQLVKYNLDAQLAIYDLSENNPLRRQHLLQEADVIFGCTGRTSIVHTEHHLLKSGVWLYSVSSYDREFDAHHLRKLVPINFCCHQDLLINNKWNLANSGFPITFDGGQDALEPKLIDPIRALMLRAVVKASLNIKQKKVRTRLCHAI